MNYEYYIQGIWDDGPGGIYGVTFIDNDKVYDILLHNMDGNGIVGSEDTYTIKQWITSFGYPEHTDEFIQFKIITPEEAFLEIL